jgi:hypothetical protein
MNIQYWILLVHTPLQPYAHVCTCGGGFDASNESDMPIPDARLRAAGSVIFVVRSIVCIQPAIYMRTSLRSWTPCTPSSLVGVCLSVLVQCAGLTYSTFGRVQRSPEEELRGR